MINIAIIGTGGMAHEHARQFQKIEGASLVACCDVDESRAKAFAESFSIPQVYTDVDALLASPDIHAVVNVTPDRFHKPISLKALAQKKHVLCEKPLAENYADASEMAEAAAAAGVVNMVNFSYRSASALYKAKELVDSGALGELRHFEADYLQSWLVGNYWGAWDKTPAFLWRLSTQHGSQGALGDIGVHIIDFMMLPLGNIKWVNCRVKSYNKNESNTVGEYTLDANDTAVMLMEAENGALGTVQVSRFSAGQSNTLRYQLHGTKGAIRINLDDDGYDQIDVCLGENVHTNTWERLMLEPVKNNYEKFVAAIQNGGQGEPDFARGAEVQKVLDACFHAHDQGAWIEV
jgi:predicted dehydrogenase